MRSLSCSSPMDRRTRPSLMPAVRRASGVHGGMGHQGRVGDQALHAAEGLGQGEDLELIDEGAHGRDAAMQLDLSMAPKPFLLARRQIVPGMGLQAGIVDRATAGWAWPAIRRPAGGRLLALDAGEQGADAPQGQPAVEGRTRGRPGSWPTRSAVRGSAGSAATTAAADHIRVAVDVFGRRMDDEVGAQGDGGAAAPATGRCCPPPQGQPTARARATEGRRRRPPASADWTASRSASGGA
jgi:hypothetical protein